MISQIFLLEKLVEIEFLKNLDFTILSNRRKVAPFGIKGGNNAKTGKNYLKVDNNLKKL